MRIVSAASMRRIEENAGNYGISSHRLMENAGSAAGAFIRRTFEVEGRSFVIFCGRGGNGGDGFVVARKIYENNAAVTLVLVDGQPISGESGEMFEMAKAMDIPMLMLESNAEKIERLVKSSDIIIDAICGTGFKGYLRPLHKQACDIINNAIAAVVSLDIPSGVECDSGCYDPSSIRADFTVTFDSSKIAHYHPNSNPLCGIVEVVDIGIPDEAKADIPSLSGILSLEHILSILKPRPADCHKGMFGRLLNISGSGRYRGAATLSCLGALRAGVGLCVIASTGDVCSAVTSHLPEAILCSLPCDESGNINPQKSSELLVDELAKANAVLLGCGLGEGSHSSRLLENVISSAKCPIVIDADGINALSKHIHLLRNAESPVIITPHPGEMARLCGVSTADISGDRAGFASRFAKDHSVVVVLKGSGTLIASPDGELFLNLTGGPGLAKGGSGDVLAGIIAAFLAQGINQFDACACGVYLHGLAGDKAASRRGVYSMLASDIALDLSDILLENGL